MRRLAALCALLVFAAGASDAAAAKTHKRPLCKPRGSQVLKRNATVRILYVEHQAQSDEYGVPATVYACLPQSHRRTKLFEVWSSEVWEPKVMRLNEGYFAFAAEVFDIVCSKYTTGDCTSYEVASIRFDTGRPRCAVSVPASALALTPSGWIAWLTPDAAGGTSRLHACDSAGTRALDQGDIDPASLRASGATVLWATAGEARSAQLG
jgi:hypothetical protein